MVSAAFASDSSSDGGDVVLTPFGFRLYFLGHIFRCSAGALKKSHKFRLETKLLKAFLKAEGTTHPLGGGGEGMGHSPAAAGSQPADIVLSPRTPSTLLDVGIMNGV